MSMTKLSVNINKIATLRNARGGNNPDVVKCAIDCEMFGADGITVHPRPDERHITYKDVENLSEVITTEFNIEGYPDSRFLKLLEETQPAQATLVPDAPDVLTSNAGWDTLKNKAFLKEIVDHIKSLGIRSSIFLDPNNAMADGAKEIGTDRVELYTESYASGFIKKEVALNPYLKTAEHCKKLGLGVNAGHDLDLKNLKYFASNIPDLREVSIGHALVSDALYFGLENTIQMYKRQLK